MQGMAYLIKRIDESWHKQSKEMYRQNGTLVLVMIHIIYHMLLNLQQERELTKMPGHGLYFLHFRVSIMEELYLMRSIYPKLHTKYLLHNLHLLMEKRHSSIHMDRIGRFLGL